MNGLTIIGRGREEEDYSGRDQKEVFFVPTNGNRKAIGEADLPRAVKLDLPELTADEARAPRRQDVAVRPAGLTGNPIRGVASPDQ